VDFIAFSQKPQHDFNNGYGFLSSKHCDLLLKNGDLQSVRLKNERNKRMKNINAEVMQIIAEHGETNNENNLMERALQRHMKEFMNNALDN